ncbi:PKD domain-containing protein [Caldimonas tepidiphila]|uniref:PKD domain-containing protein n=1 Tax=Caldimonas tepidiphila TaxID=2315841 RepID=UPI0013009B8D|nr:PKD domain-containing protein [Caldimonas tepidiphila]
MDRESLARMPLLLRRRLLLALAGTTLAGLAACGGGGEGPDVAAAAAAKPERARPLASHDPAATTYRVTQLPLPVESAFVFRNGLNEAGQVAGQQFTAEGGRGFFFDGAGIHYFTPSAPFASGAWRSSVRFVNGLDASGRVVGSYDYEQADTPPERAGVQGNEAFLWSREGGFVRVTPNLWAESRHLGSAGHVAGTVYRPDGRREGFLWSARDGLRTDFGAELRLEEAWVVNGAGLLGAHGSQRGLNGALLIDTISGRTTLVPGTGEYGRVADINEAGDAAGEVLTAGDRFHAFFANPSRGIAPIDLGPAVGAEHDAFAVDLNERGELLLSVNRRDRPPETRGAAYLWSQALGAIEMGTPPGAHASPSAINNHGLVVGSHDVWRGAEYAGSRAFAWTRESGMVDLASRVQNAPQGFRLHFATAVNDSGVILAGADSGLVLLTPVTAPPASQPPLVGAITGTETAPAGARATFAATFSDVDAAETHSATWNWGDGSAPQAGSVSGSGGAGRVEGAHVYRSAGVYTVSLRVTDSGGRSTEVSREIVIHDRGAGFVKGNGWLRSPAGADAQAPAAAGRAHFNFVARYKQAGKSRKEHSKAAFSFRTERLHFHGRALEVLEIDGPRARLEGVGSLNGERGHRFELTALDGATRPGDRLRVRIWRDERQGGRRLVYDSQPTGTPGAPLGGGNIVVRPR